MKQWGAVLILAGGFLACSKDTTEPPPPPPPLVLGTLALATPVLPISAVAGTALVLTIRALSTTNEPMPSQTVALAVTGGGGSVTASSTSTDAQGNATASWVLGTTAGANALTATSGSATLSVTATGIPGAAAKLIVVTAPSGTVQARIPVPTQPSVRLQDVNNNTVAQAGVVVTATITAGGGLLTGAIATTDASGLATFSGLAIGGVVGPRTLSFSGPGLAPVSAAVNLTAGVAAIIAALSGENQSAPTNAVLGFDVRVTDLDANAVQGTVVTFAVPGSNIASLNQTTGAAGTAGVTWRIGVLPGPYTLTGTASGLVGSPVAFTATATPGVCPPTSLLLQQSRSANLQPSQCAISSFLAPSSFTGPVAGGTYYFDAYSVDVAANAIVHVDVTGTGSIFFSTGAYDRFGVRLAYECCGTATVLNNAASAAAKSFLIIVISRNSGETGPYTIVTRRVL